MGVRPSLLTRGLACSPVSLSLSLSVSLSFFPSKSTEVGITMDNDLNATYEACNNFNTKLKDTIMGLINANSDRKSEIDGLRGDHDKLRSDHDAFVDSMERENDLRKNEIKSLEERTQKDNQARITDIAKLEGKLDTENGARKEEIKNLDSWAKGENDARKADIAAINQRLDAEQNARDSEDKALNERITKEISDREAANAELLARMDAQNDDKARELEELRTRMMKENAFLKSLADKSLGVFFDAYRTKAYDGGGEENLTFNGTYCNVGGGFDADTGIFTAPCGGSYMFMFHIATHDNKKALLSIRKNGEEIASIFDQNHKDNHKNSMAGQNIVLDVKRGDEIVVYAYTGTWLADFPMNHYTHWVGLLLKPSQEEADMLRKAVEEGEDPCAAPVITEEEEE